MYKREPANGSKNTPIYDYNDEVERCSVSVVKLAESHY